MVLELRAANLWGNEKRGSPNEPVANLEALRYVYCSEFGARWLQSCGVSAIGRVGEQY